MPFNFGKNVVPRIPQAVASFNFDDIAEGTGIVVFHGGNTKTSSGAYKYVLRKNEFYSNEISSGGIVAGTVDNKLLDMDFDVTFNKPKIIDGEALVSIPVGVSGNVAASNYVGYVAVAVQKVSDGVETELYALTSGSLVNTAESFQSERNTILLDLPRTTFKIGDKLRLQIQLYGRGNGADSAYVLIGMDPKNRVQSGSLSEETLKWVSGDADLQFHVPFKLDI